MVEHLWLSCQVGVQLPLVPVATWQLAATHHEQIVATWTSDRLHRRSRGLKHPVDDFMFEYYPISVSKLATWHPGWRIELEPKLNADEIFNVQLYSIANSIRLRVDIFQARLSEIANELEFLTATLNRSARTGCFGLHEWAMVLGESELRHDQWPLRISQSEIAQTISDIGLRCTHFDAFRFFTEVARPLNPLQLVRTDQLKVEQPGCLHANMDLYKIAMRWAPIIGSVLVRQCFRLAREIRTLDMQSAPYDLRDLGVTPIPIETTQGRQEFTRQQKRYSDRAQVLRTEIIKQLLGFKNAFMHTGI